MEKNSSVRTSNPPSSALSRENTECGNGPLGGSERRYFKTWEIIALTFLTIVKLFREWCPSRPLEAHHDGLTGGGPGSISMVPLLAVISINLGS
jgi:hypothetical protein